MTSIPKMSLRRVAIHALEQMRHGHIIVSLSGLHKDCARVDKPGDLIVFFQQMQRAVDKFISHIVAERVQQPHGHIGQVK